MEECVGEWWGLVEGSGGNVIVGEWRSVLVSSGDWSRVVGNCEFW